MGLYRIFSSQDSWITNKLIDNVESIRATGSNLGASPALNVFKLTGSVAASKVELARTLIKFNVSELSGKIYTDLTIPSSSVSYYLKMFDMPHGKPTPVNYDLFVYPLSRSWDEGVGIDADTFRDSGPVSWLSASTTAPTAWNATGSDFFLAEYGTGSQRVSTTDQDLEINITDTVINWLTGAISNNGVVIKLGTSEEEDLLDYYTKMFHGRESQFIDKLPYIEARWNSVEKDNRNNFGFNTNNKLFMYNFIRGELTQVSETVSCRIQDNLSHVSASYSGTFTTNQIANGVLTASILIERTGNIDFSSSFYDIWYSTTRVYMTGAFTPLFLTASSVDQYDEFVLDVTNLKGKYGTNEEARVKVNVRKRDYKTHKVVATASLGMDREYIEKLYFKIENDETGETIVPYGTGSVPHTQLSYNGDGNYFNIWMNSFVPGFKYRIKFLVDINRYDVKEIDDNFLFKVI